MNDDLTFNLKRQLNSTDASQRSVVLVLVGKSRVHSLTEHVIMMLEHDSDDKVRAMAAMDIGCVGKS